jgi:hypothetical protein
MFKDIQVRLIAGTDQRDICRMISSVRNICIFKKRASKKRGVKNKKISYLENMSPSGHISQSYLLGRNTQTPRITRILISVSVCMSSGGPRVSALISRDSIFWKAAQKYLGSLEYTYCICQLVDDVMNTSEICTAS